MENRYEVIIFWSDEDQSSVADVPELPGCAAHGGSHAEALQNAQEAIELWIETARKDGRVVPRAKGRRLLYAQSPEHICVEPVETATRSDTCTALWARRPRRALAVAAAAKEAARLADAGAPVEIYLPHTPLLRRVAFRKWG